MSFMENDFFSEKKVLLWKALLAEKEVYRKVYSENAVLL